MSAVSAVSNKFTADVAAAVKKIADATQFNIIMSHIYSLIRERFEIRVIIVTAAVETLKAMNEAAVGMPAGYAEAIPASIELTIIGMRDSLATREVTSTLAATLRNMPVSGEKKIKLDPRIFNDQFVRDPSEWLIAVKQTLEQFNANPAGFVLE